jgi:hypothetical protein
MNISLIIGCSSIGNLTGKPTGLSATMGGADRDFVISVETNLPHKFPEGVTKGVWVSSVPLGLDVYAYPKGYSGSNSVRYSSVEPGGAYYLGQTPLLANLKNGTYEIDIVHPPITDENFTPRYSTRFDKRYGFNIRTQVFPFIMPRNPILKAEFGDYYWVQRVEVEVNDDFNTAIVLFQREDQETADMLRLLPEEKNFKFHSPDRLKNLDLKKKLGKEFIVETESDFSITSEEFAQAIEMLERGGVWAKRFDDNVSVSFEVLPAGRDDFRAIVHHAKRGDQGKSQQQPSMPEEDAGEGTDAKTREDTAPDEADAAAEAGPRDDTASTDYRYVMVSFEYKAGFGVLFPVAITIDDRAMLEYSPNMRTVKKLSTQMHKIKISDPKKGLFNLPDWSDYEIALDLEKYSDAKVIVHGRNILVGFQLELIVVSRGEEISKHKIALR